MTLDILSIINRDSEVRIVPPKDYPNFSKEAKNFIQYAHLPNDPLKEIAPYKELFKIPTHLGLEVEVEGVKPLPLPKFWSSKEDNSLRDGIEFTTVPLPPEEAMVASVLLWASLGKLNGKKPSFSWRTSFQVHINVQALSEEEFKNFLLLAIAFEGMLFALAGDRSQSNFCVPLAESDRIETLGYYFRKKTSLRTLAMHWPKYTAVNLCRMWPFGPNPPQGTVEFRHLGGTDDVKKILLWQALVLQLFNAAVAIPTKELHEDISSLNTTGKYLGFIKKVLAPQFIPTMSDLRGVFASSIARAKQVLIIPPKATPPIKASSSVAKQAIKAYQEHTKRKGVKIKASNPFNFEVIEVVNTPIAWANTTTSTGGN